LLAGGGYTVPVSGYFQASTQTAVYAFQRDHGLPQTGNLDVPTWGPLMQNKPLAVRWTTGGAVAAGSSGRVALPPPKSAKLPAVRNEIPPPSKRG
jgi:peptidoglycan hydrolase-like protein with peptidoglycan-binding domain